jgi:hypothetical protein
VKENELAFIELPTNNVTNEVMKKIKRKNRIFMATSRANGVMG